MGEEICLGARIFALALILEETLVEFNGHWDGIAAATTHIVKRAGTALDPCLVAAFCRIRPERWIEERERLPDTSASDVAA